MTKSLTPAVPPAFYEDDLEKWHKKFDTPNKLQDDQKEMLRKAFNYNFPKSSKASVSFTNTDPLLLHGNTAEVCIEYGNKGIIVFTRDNQT